MPLPMFSVFSGADAVQQMLNERAAQLAAALDRVRLGREYALRVYRVDDALIAALPALSERIRAHARSAARSVVVPRDERAPDVRAEATGARRSQPALGPG